MIRRSSTWSESPSTIGEKRVFDTARIVSLPPDGDFEVTNLFVKSANGKLEVEYETAGDGAASAIISTPPTGEKEVVNLYVSAATGKLVAEYEDTPTP